MDKEGSEFNSELPVEAKKRKIITQNLGFNVLWAFSLIFIAAGVVTFPMFHHIAFIAGLAMQVTGNIWLAGIFGVIALLLGDTIGVVTNVETKSHVDPPAGAIAILSTILLVFFKIIVK